MATKNKALTDLTEDDVKRISERFLMGWQNLMRYGFRLAGFNRKREEFGLEPLTREMSFNYRLDYVKNHYSYEEQKSQVESYLENNLMDEQRWQGIELFGCRFGREYSKFFKELFGASMWRKMSETARKNKLVKTQLELYGGVGLANDVAKNKAVETNLKRYGCKNVMQNSDIQSRLAVVNNARYGGMSPFSSKEIRDKAMLSKIHNSAEAVNMYFKTGNIECLSKRMSPCEVEVFVLLLDRYGKGNVYYQYGLHPYDKRYPYNCDFYIKSADLFIELNVHWSHGGHWYDENNKSDINRRNQLSASDSKRSRNSVVTWCETDVKKRLTAKNSGIKYLVFWSNKLTDFYKWLNDYNCDYDSFVLDNPLNTY